MSQLAQLVLRRPVPASLVQNAPGSLVPDLADVTSSVHLLCWKCLIHPQDRLQSGVPDLTWGNSLLAVQMSWRVADGSPGSGMVIPDREEQQKCRRRLALYSSELIWSWHSEWGKMVP